MTRMIIIKDLHNNDMQEEKKLKKFLDDNNWHYSQYITDESFNK